MSRSAEVAEGEIRGISFGFFPSDEARRLSVCAISVPALFDASNRPVPGGLYDEALGPVSRDSKCRTCGMNADHCPGHCGHIDLPTPMYHPMLFDTCYKLLRSTCFYCHRFRFDPRRVALVRRRVDLLDLGLLLESHELSVRCTFGLTDDIMGTGGSRSNRTTEYDLEEIETVYHELLASALEREHCNGADPISQLRKHMRASILSMHVRNERRRLVRDLLRDAVAAKKCFYCSLSTPTIRQENHVKIFRQALPAAARRAVEDVYGVDGQLYLDEALDRLLSESGLQEGLEGKSRAEDTDRNSDVDDAMSVSSSSSSSTDFDSELSENEDPTRQSREVSSLVENDGELESEKSKSKSNSKGSSGMNSKKSRKGDSLHASSSKLTFITSLEVRERLKRLWTQESAYLSTIFRIVSDDGPSVSPTSYTSFFLDSIIVPPNKTRPPARMGDSLFEHQQNVVFMKIVKASHALVERMRDDTTRNAQDIVNMCVELQRNVNNIMDSSGSTAQTEGGGIRQVLEKKEGLFRQNMMGKRVNFAARSVISPDPNLETNEIGIPLLFAQRLTYPEPVNPMNVSYLRQLVTNGPDSYPGANYVIDERDRKIDLSKKSKAQRLAIAKTLLTGSSNAEGGTRPKIVLRQLRNGDMLLVNRQPTLHKSSMMTHRVRVLSDQKTIRMHYANCKTYNADFDGDEINLHCAQNPLAQAEARFISNTDNQYIIPTSGEPIRGLIQDHVCGGVLLTMKDAFLTEEEYHILLYGSLYHLSPIRRIHTVAPFLMKPKKLWTGKQVISSILRNIVEDTAPPLSMTCKAKVPGSVWTGSPEEGHVIVRSSELVTGVLDKNQFGASEYGLVHAVYECYGAGVAGSLLTIFGRLFTLYVQLFGLTCGLDDLILNKDAEKERSKQLQSANICPADVYGKNASISRMSAVASSLESPEDLIAGRFDQSEFEDKMEAYFKTPNNARLLDNDVKGELKKFTSTVIKTAIPGGQVVYLFRFLLRTKLEGYKAFPQNNFSLMTTSGAKGSIVNMSQIMALLGQQEFEGRRVQPMPSGKTLPSFCRFDPQARASGYVGDRFLTGIRPQEYFFHCMAGRDGLVDTAVKTSRSGYLQRCLIKHLEGLSVAYDHTVRDCDGSVVQFRYGEDSLDPCKVSYIRNMDFIADNIHVLAERFSAESVLQSFDVDVYADPKVQKHTRRLRKHGRLSSLSNPVMPTLAIFDPGCHFGCVSEEFQRMVDEYVTNDRSKLTSSQNRRKSSVHPDTFRAIMNLKYLRSLVEPGEAVGLIAAQSVGEPSTQMTLNTFHFAGVDMAHVTVGIPRLRELLMTGSVKQPVMQLPLRPEIPREMAEKVAFRLAEVPFRSLVASISRDERFMVPPGSTRRMHRAQIRLRFLSTKLVQDVLNISEDEIHLSFLSLFIPRLVTIIRKEIKRSGGDDAEFMDFLSTRTLNNVESVVGEVVGDLKNLSRPGANADEDDENMSKSQNIDVDVESGDEDEADDESAEGELRKQEDIDYDDTEDEESGEDGDETDSDESVAQDADQDVREADARLEHHEKQLSSTMEILSSFPSKSVSSKPTSSKPVVPQTATSAVQPVDDASRIRILTDNVTVRYREVVDVAFHSVDGRCEAMVEIEIPASVRKLLLDDLTERACSSVLVRSTQGISACVVGERDTPNGGSELVLHTTGANFVTAWKMANVIDIRRMYCNDIKAILESYGVEAARKLIARELKNVFDAYGIAVDMRHLGLIADYMTFEGGWKPFNRIGMANQSSPFLRMSYETTVKFLIDSTLDGDAETLKSPSSRIVVGQPVRSGTGSFDLVHPIVV